MQLACQLSQIEFTSTHLNAKQKVTIRERERKKTMLHSANWRSTSAWFWTTSKTVQWYITNITSDARSAPVRLLHSARRASASKWTSVKMGLLRACAFNIETRSCAPGKGLFGYSHPMWIGWDWKKLWKILTCLGLKPIQSHPIHMDWEQNEQALKVHNVSFQIYQAVEQHHLSHQSYTKKELQVSIIYSGINMWTTRPVSCWQLPVRSSYHIDTLSLISTIKFDK
jgi:hypothetical protein